MVDLLKKKQKMRRVKSLEKAEKKKKICIERGTAHCRSRFLIKPKILFTFLFLFTRRVCMYKKLFVCIHVMSLSLSSLSFLPTLRLPPYPYARATSYSAA